MPKGKKPEGRSSDKITFPLTLRAIVQRINRKLRSDDQTLKATRGARAHSNVGDFYVLDFNRNIIKATHVDPVAFARELKVIAPWEGLAAEE